MKNFTKHSKRGAMHGFVPKKLRAAEKGGARAAAKRVISGEEAVNRCNSCMVSYEECPHMTPGYKGTACPGPCKDVR